MPASYNNQPISGFTGHLPGAKWQVGSRYVPPESMSTSNISPGAYISPNVSRIPRTGYEFSAQPHVENFPINYTSQQHVPDKSRISFQDHLNVDSNHGVSVEPGGHQQASPVSILRPGSSQMSVGYTAQGIPVRYPPHMQPGNSENVRVYHNETPDPMVYSMPNGVSNSSSSMIRYNDHPGSQPYAAQFSNSSEQFNDGRRHEQNNKPAEVQQRSRSIPRRRIEKDPFEGIEGGWWSKGEVLRNKERRELANRGQTILGGQYSYNLPSAESSNRQWQQAQKEEENDIPAAGYSGHIQGLRQLGIGKSFNAAAKEAKKEYFERRRARSGGREQFYDRSQSNYDLSRSNNVHTRQDY